MKKINNYKQFNEKNTQTGDMIMEKLILKQEFKNLSKKSKNHYYVKINGIKYSFYKYFFDYILYINKNDIEQSVINEDFDPFSLENLPITSFMYNRLTHDSKNRTYGFTLPTPPSPNKEYHFSRKYWKIIKDTYNKYNY